MGITGIMYMMFPQLPSSAIVALSQYGQNTDRRELEMGPKVFHTRPYIQNTKLQS